MLASCAPAAAQGGGSEGFPDLSAYGVPWDPNWPTPPNITNSPATVSNDSELSTAQGTNGRVITIADGSSITSIDMGGLDHSYIVGAGCTIGQIHPVAGGRRNAIKWNVLRDDTSTAGIINTGNGFVDVEDFDFNGVRTASTSANRCDFGGHRIAVRNSYLGTGQYGIYVNEQSSYLNFHNTTVDSGNHSAEPQSLVRITSPERLTITRCRLVKRGIGLLVRLYTQSDCWVSYNQIEAAESSGNNAGCEVHPTGFSSLTPTTGLDTYGTNFRNNAIYNDSGGPMQAYQGPTNGLAVIRDNDTYGGSIPTTGVPTGWTVTSNNSNSFTTPPAWSFL